MTVRRVQLKITPDAALRVNAQRNVPHSALLAQQPVAIVGSVGSPPLASCGVKADKVSCFGPRGAVLTANDGPLWVCDTGHHRLLGWKHLPAGEGTPADWFIGQPDWNHEGRNGKSAVNATSLNVPTGICAYGKGLAVADAWNHRVLIWHTTPTTNNVPADIVLGQADFNANESNRGLHYAAANTFHWPYGVASNGEQLFVADAENRRVLIWHQTPTHNGQAADQVLGQTDFHCRDENAGTEPSAMSMRWPHGMAFWRGNLCVSDAGNNRVMVWSGIPTTNGEACTFVLGQASETKVDHNQSLYWPRANTLNMPYGITTCDDWLIAADTASSRLVAWHIDDLQTNAAARALFGQINFHEKGDNRWQPACADSLCWPYNVAACGNKLVIADSGNNRVSVWTINT